MSRPFRRDSTHVEIASTLRACGFRCWDLTPYRASIDMLVLVGTGDGARLFLVDAKASANAPRTVTQERMLEEGWPIIFGTTGEEIVAQIQARRAA